MHVSKEEVNEALHDMRSVIAADAFNPLDTETQEAIRTIGNAEEMRKYAAASLMRTAFTLATVNREAEIEKVKQDFSALGEPLLPVLTVAFLAGLKAGAKQAEVNILKSWEDSQKA